MAEEQRLQFSTHWWIGVPPERRKDVASRTDQIRGLVRRTTRDLVDIGQHLLAVKALLGHGAFCRWLEQEFSWSHMTAWRFMNVARTFSGISQDVTFDATALYALAAPTVSAEARAEAIERAKRGQHITAAAAKQIVAAHRPPCSKRHPAENLPRHSSTLSAQGS